MAAPTVQTVEPEAITDTTVILRGYCWEPGSDTAQYVILGCGTETPQPNDIWFWGAWRQVTSVNVPGYFVAKITGLTPNTVYHALIMSRDNMEPQNENEGGYIEFKTRADAPDGVAGHYWVENLNWCYIDAAGYKRVIKGEG